MLLYNSNNNDNNNNNNNNTYIPIPILIYTGTDIYQCEYNIKPPWISIYLTYAYEKKYRCMYS